MAEPLDEPDGLILGQCVGGRRFVVNLNCCWGGPMAVNQLENIDGKPGAIDKNAVFKKGRRSQIVCSVRRQAIQVAVDGREVIAWKGDDAKLNLTDYWKTPRKNVLFIGAFNCRYRISQVTLKPISGMGRSLDVK
jgi:hypothetical protein